MRTQDEIVARLRTHTKCVLCFAPDVLLPLLDFEHARPFLKVDTTAEKWKEAVPVPPDLAAIEKEGREYMAEYGWGKAQDHRGISANRSVEKLTEWAWLLGHDEVVARIAAEEIEYPQYGAPILKAICEAAGWPIPDDPGLVRMMAGQRCADDCNEGCS